MSASAASGASKPSPSQMRRSRPDDVVDADAAEVEALAARVDRLGNLVRVRGREDEDDVAGRLLERLEQRVERRSREHVDLVDDVDLVAPAGGREAHAADDLLADVVHARARCGVELVDVGVAPLGDLDAVLARAVGLAGGALLAVERLGEQARGRGLAGAARTGEQVRVGDRPVGDGVAQRALDVLLADDVVEGLRAVLPVQGLMRHVRPFEW